MMTVRRDTQVRAAGTRADPFGHSAPSTASVPRATMSREEKPTFTPTQPGATCHPFERVSQ